MRSTLSFLKLTVLFILLTRHPTTHKIELTALLSPLPAALKYLNLYQLTSDVRNKST